MYDVRHSKEHHPEGNVWDHTLETFAYRKTTDLSLSYSLLFHDAGKPIATPNEGRRFDRHAQIGGGIAVKFLRKLGYTEGLIKDVSFLVREHMLPAFLHELPTYRTEHVMSSHLFPLLLELYRCDLSSTYRGPDGYYRACKVYRAYLKNVRNPFRTPDGKKLLKRYVYNGR
jgi:poly(A) polymerase